MNCNKLNYLNKIGIISLIILVSLVIYLIYYFTQKNKIEGFAVPTILPKTNPYRYYEWTITDNNYLLENGHTSTVAGKSSPDNMIEVSKFMFYDINNKLIDANITVSGINSMYSPLTNPVSNLINYTNNKSWIDYNAPKGSYETDMTKQNSNLINNKIRNGGTVIFDFGSNYYDFPAPIYYNWVSSSISYLRDPTEWSIKAYNNPNISTKDSLVSVIINNVNKIPRNGYYNNFYNSLYPSLSGTQKQLATSETTFLTTLFSSSLPVSTTNTTEPGSTTNTTVPGSTTNTTEPGTTNTTVPGSTTNTTVPGSTTNTTVPGSTTNTTVPGSTTNTTVPGSTTNTTVPGSTTNTTVPGSPTNTTVPGSPTNTTVPGSPTNTTVPGSPTNTTVPGSPTNTTVPGSTTNTTVPGLTPTNTTVPGLTPTNTTAPSRTTPNITIIPPALHSTITPGMGNFSVSHNGLANGFNVSQKDGKGTNNYFTPNIYIKRKKNNNSDDTDTKRIEFGLGEELQPFLYGLGRQGMMQSATDFVYDNTGYNFGNYPAGTGTGSRNDPFNSATRNANVSSQYEQTQPGTCIDCDVSEFGMEYKGNVDYFDNTSNRTRDYSASRDNTDASDISGKVDSKGNFIHSCKMKKFHPGYQLQPPTCWDVPQKRPPVCLSDKKCLPAAVFDSGLSLNALQFDTAVGSIMPGFTYVEHPRT